jgi:hypothetical protein
LHAGISSSTPAASISRTLCRSCQGGAAAASDVYARGELLNVAPAGISARAPSERLSISLTSANQPGLFHERKTSQKPLRSKLIMYQTISAVKKLKLRKNRLRKSLVSKRCILRFGRFCQFFHSF